MALRKLKNRIEKKVAFNHRWASRYAQKFEVKISLDDGTEFTLNFDETPPAQKPWEVVNSEGVTRYYTEKEVAVGKLLDLARAANITRDDQYQITERRW